MLGSQYWLECACVSTALASHSPAFTRRGTTTTHARRTNITPTYFHQGRLSPKHDRIAHKAHLFRLWQTPKRPKSPSKKSKKTFIKSHPPSSQEKITKTNAVYSDVYFKSNRSLNGVLKNISDYNQQENNSLVCSDYFLGKTYLENPHLAIFELRKTIEYHAVLCGMYLQYDYEMTVPAFRAKCFERYEKSMSSFHNYVPLIRIDNDIYEQYFYEKKWDEFVSRISIKDAQKRVESFLSHEDLDRISPVRGKDEYEMVPTSEREILKLSSLSVHELEEVLFKRKDAKDKRVKIRSLEDVRFSRHYPLLEPLILKDEEFDNKKARLRIAEHKKIVRITIAYTLAFFILVIVTFFIIYFA